MTQLYCESVDNSSCTITVSADYAPMVFDDPLIDGYKLSEHPRREGIEAAIRYLKEREGK